MSKKSEYLPKLRAAQLEVFDYVTKFCDKAGIEYFLIGGTLIGALRHKGYIPWDDDIDIAMSRADYDRFFKEFPETDRFKLDDYNTNGGHFWLPFGKVRNVKTDFVQATTKDYPGSNGIWVDIFPFDNAEDVNTPENNRAFYRKKLWGEFIMRKSNVNVELPNTTSNKIKNILAKIIPRRFAIKRQLAAMTKDKNDESKYIISYNAKKDANRETYLRSMVYPTKKVVFEGRKVRVPRDADAFLTQTFGDYMTIPPKSEQVTHMPLYVSFEDGTKLDFRKK